MRNVWLAIVIAVVACACTQTRVRTDKETVSIWDTPTEWKQTVRNETVCPAHPAGFVMKAYCDGREVAVIPPGGDAIIAIAKQSHPNSYELVFKGVAADGNVIVAKAIAVNDLDPTTPRPTWRLNRFTLFGDPPPTE